MVKASAWHIWLDCRRRLLRSMLLTLVIAIALFPLTRPLFTWYASPLWQQLPTASHLIALDLISGFWVPVELSLVFAVLLALPWWLLEAWWWLKPGLYRHEQGYVRRALGLSFVLFSLGLLFAYKVVLPLMVHFLLFAAPHAVVMMPDIAVYVAFSLRLLFCFGLLFELPLLLVLMVRFAWVSKLRLKSWRRYVLVLSFILGMIIAPDPFSQCLLALPLYALYEFGMWCAPTVRPLHLKQ